MSVDPIAALPQREHVPRRYRGPQPENWQIRRYGFPRYPGPRPKPWTAGRQRRKQQRDKAEGWQSPV